MQIRVVVCALMLLVNINSSKAGSDPDEWFELDALVADSRFHEYLKTPVRIDILVTDLGWAEGPVWIESQKSLLFSDVAADTIYRWQEGNGLSEYLSPSGHEPDNGGNAWRGSNGLAIDNEGRLILAQQSARRVARMEATIGHPKARFRVLASHFETQRFNSPNDLVVASNGDIYFTDPPYGLSGFENSPDLELPFFGVFRLSVGQDPEVLATSLSKPNGLALSGDQSRLYVSNSEAGNPGIYLIELRADQKPRAELLFDARALAAVGTGSTDGMAMHRDQILFASVPGGLALISEQGELIGTIHLGQVTNAAFDKCYCHLYLTTPNRLLRIKMNSGLP
ncbi:MAG: SMP-30/gluconolactonase/LRE family protein [Pseudomonadota bacterium]